MIHNVEGMVRRVSSDMESETEPHIHPQSRAYNYMLHRCDIDTARADSEREVAIPDPHGSPMPATFGVLRDVGSEVEDAQGAREGQR